MSPGLGQSLSLFFLLVATPNIVFAQKSQIDVEAAQVIEKFLVAMGGEMSLESIKSFCAKSEHVLPSGPVIPVDIKVLQNKVCSAILRGKVGINDGIGVNDGTYTWFYSVDNGGQPLLIPQLGPSHDHVPFPHTVLSWRSLGGKVSVIGETTLDQRRQPDLSFRK